MANKRKDAGEAEIQAKFDRHHEQGLVGEKVDPRPNSDYTAPKASPKPTPTKKGSDE